jgi:predicted ATPase
MPIPSWTLDVTGLGPIKKAEIEVRPLTLLVGENSTGKSYLATLLWGLAQVSLFSSPFGQVIAPEFRELSKRIDEEGKRFTFSTESIEYVFSLINSLLARLKAEFISSLFNQQQVQVGGLALRQAGTYQPDTLPTLNFSLPGPAVQYPSMIGKMRFAEILSHLFGTGEPFVPAIYLPASRTGFLLTYPYVVSRGIDALFADDTPAATARTRLTRPTIEFLKLLATGADDRSGFVAEAEALEEALGGEIVKHSRAGFNQYEYRMKGASVALPMSIVSTVVSELAPIVLVLKHSEKLPFLVIEEPEAHLHPKVQRMLAVVIARLIRKGVRVVLTTHGDLFCHQLNNLVKLGALPVAKRRALQRKFKLKETDYLLPDEVSGYGLMLSKDRTHSVVSALQMTDYGLAMPTFNAEIDSLEAQTEALDTAIEAGQ